MTQKYNQVPTDSQKQKRKRHFNNNDIVVLFFLFFFMHYDVDSTIKKWPTINTFHTLNMVHGCDNLKKEKKEKKIDTGSCPWLSAGVQKPFVTQGATVASCDVWLKQNRAPVAKQVA